MWTLAQVQAEYRRLDRLLGIDTSRVAVSFSRRMMRQYGVCTFVKNRPQEIRLADFLRREDQVFWDTARHEYAHAAAAILTGKRHGHDEAWKAVCRKIGCPPERLAPSCGAAVENRRRIESVRGVYVVTCLGCGAESRYLRRGTVVQALEEKRGGIRCPPGTMSRPSTWMQRPTKPRAADANAVRPLISTLAARLSAVLN